MQAFLFNIKVVRGLQYIIRLFICLVWFIVCLIGIRTGKESSFILISFKITSSIYFPLFDFVAR